jgi:hypothetical protein
MSLAKKKKEKRLKILFFLFSQTALGYLGESVEKKEFFSPRARYLNKNLSETYFKRTVSSHEKNKIEEFVNTKTLKIFALRWEGVMTIDLSVYFGSYFPEYQKNLQQIKESKKDPTRRQSRRSAEIKADDLEVKTWSTGRSSHGLAIIPSLTPLEFNLDALQ